MPKNKKRSKTDSFLEAFRDLTGGGNAAGFNQTPGPEANNPKEDPWLLQQELEKRYQSQLSRSETVRREEKLLYSRQQREAEQKIAYLQSEIQQLAKETGELAHEVQISSMQSAKDNVSTYHLSFFERLAQLIKKLRAQLHESALWLEAWNKKAQKKNTYWKGVKKAGSKYLLSSDRYMATQAG